mmetsp:Transcript_5650/g.17811  ORF Transcript_5650/g.17811 Transcript_5650/m.17811 type:complete len:279 (-) Transcript_5650:31-867(-)
MGPAAGGGEAAAGAAGAAAGAPPAAGPGPLPSRGCPRASSSSVSSGCSASMHGTASRAHSATSWVQRSEDARVKMIKAPDPPSALRASSTALLTSATEHTSGSSVNRAACGEPNCAQAFSASRRAPAPVLSDTAKTCLGSTLPPQGVTSKSTPSRPSGRQRALAGEAGRRPAIRQRCSSRRSPRTLCPATTRQQTQREARSAGAPAAATPAALGGPHGASRPSRRGWGGQRDFAAAAAAALGRNPAKVRPTSSMAAGLSRTRALGQPRTTAACIPYPS